jgi:hypothetical protein
MVKIRVLPEQWFTVPSIRKCGLRGLRSSSHVPCTTPASRGLICGYCRRNSSLLNCVVLLSRLSTLGLHDLALRSCLAVQRSRRSSSSIAARYGHEIAPWLFYGIPAQSRQSGGPLPPLNTLQQPI